MLCASSKQAAKEAGEGARLKKVGWRRFCGWKFSAPGHTDFKTPTCENSVASWAAQVLGTRAGVAKPGPRLSRTLHKDCCSTQVFPLPMISAHLSIGLSRAENAALDHIATSELVLVWAVSVHSLDSRIVEFPSLNPGRVPRGWTFAT
jgi:hypothetical protein